MANGYNKVHLVGNVGNDPEFKQLNKNTLVCVFSVATNSGYFDTTGTWVDRVEWHRIKCWNRLAENCHKHLKKGMLVFVSGPLAYSKWEDKDGNKHQTAEITAKYLKFMNNGAKGNSPE